MKYLSLRHIFFLLLPFLFLIASCAPEVKFRVTRPAQLAVDNVQMVSIGTFEDSLGEEIKLPPLPEDATVEKDSGMKPTISNFFANSESADIVRAMLVADISKYDQYKILKTVENSPSISGVLPDNSKVGIINAKVKYFEYQDQNAEEVFYMLLATKGGLELREQLLLEGIKAAASSAAERDKKGFVVPTPYIEKIGAMEVVFDLVRKSNGEKVVPTQTFRSFYVRKWGGNDTTSHLPETLKEVIVDTYQEDESFSSTVSSSADEVSLALSDPHEFLARGGKLRKNPTVPKSSLDIQLRLAKHISHQYIKRISRYHEETVLEIESGDSIAVNYLEGNAFEKAINRLENLPQRSEEDIYNLGLAYESIGEGHQAAKYYQQAVNKDPGNDLFTEALNRVKR